MVYEDLCNSYAELSQDVLTFNTAHFRIDALIEACRILFTALCSTCIMFSELLFIFNVFAFLDHLGYNSF